MSQAELIARGHAILDEAPRDYSAITNLVTEALVEGWREGYRDGVIDHMAGMTGENAMTNPYREELA